MLFLFLIVLRVTGLGFCMSTNMFLLRGGYSSSLNCSLDNKLQIVFVPHVKKHNTVHYHFQICPIMKLITYS